jgi:acyl dehydratase
VGIATRTPDDVAPEAEPLPVGTYEEALTWVGKSRSSRVGAVDVNDAMIKAYASRLEDGNPAYWDDEIADGIWGGRISPPGMLLVWLRPLQWQPDGTVPGWPLAPSVPLPGDTLIGTTTETEFYRPMRIGDRLSVVETVLAVSPEKKTAAGPGHFVKTEARYRNQDGRLVAVERLTLLRFSSGKGTAS